MSNHRASSSQGKARATEASPAEGEIILLVEDEASVRNLVTRFLSLSAFRVLAAADARTALSLWAEHQGKIGLLLTDVIMPGAMSGRTLAARFQADRPDLKILYTSGYTAESLNADGTLEDEINFLQKPYRPEQLLAAVRAVLAGNYQTHSESLC